jgi:lipopolysaccharide/colanic/teichoic acid biosynthesis glycosyltransferase
MRIKATMQESNSVPVLAPEVEFAPSGAPFIDERQVPREEIGFRGGEPFPNLLGFEGTISFWTIGPSFKRAFDIVGALLLAIVFAPLLLVIPLLMWRQGGQILYRHRRVGLNGELFPCMKFRTMMPDADRLLWRLLGADPSLRTEWLSTQKLQNDPRVTALGRFLRRTSLDELPQLWNILRGDMSLVGPRPVVPEELSRYGRNASVYLAAKPGLTGLWQVSGRSTTTYRRRVALDVYYVRYGGALMDLKILYRTAGVIFRRQAC